MTPYDLSNYHRRSIRLKEHDYSQAGAYFFTACVKNKEYLFGEIAGGEMQLNTYGEIVKEEWCRSEKIRCEIGLDEFVIMPNHIHGIVWLGIHSFSECSPVRAHGRAPLQRKPRSLGSFIAGFKSSTAKHINASRTTPGAPVWQRNYYERVVRNDRELAKIREYILTNPIQWAMDRENPARTDANPLDSWLYKEV